MLDLYLLLVFLGRSWSIQELREKSWDDLHALWWVCIKERNRIATSDLERVRLRAGYGEWESTERDRVVSLSSSILLFFALYGCDRYLRPRRVFFFQFLETMLMQWCL